MIRARSRETKADRETLYEKRPLLKFKKSYSIKYSKKKSVPAFPQLRFKKRTGPKVPVLSTRMKRKIVYFVSSPILPSPLMSSSERRSTSLIKPSLIS